MGYLFLLTGIIFILVSLIFGRIKEKFDCFVSALIGITHIALAIREGTISNIFDKIVPVVVSAYNFVFGVFIDIFEWIVDTFLFLFSGRVDIPMFWLYGLLFIGFLVGIVVMSLMVAAKEGDRRSGVIDGTKLVRNLNNKESDY